MKHVWILNHYAQEPSGIGGTRHFALARHLPNHGWKASIIAASTDHVSGRQRLDNCAIAKREAIDNTEFLWVRTPEYSGNGVDRIRNMLAYSRNVLRKEVLSHLAPPDAVIGSSVHPFAAWAARRLARRYNVPFIFEVRDLWPQTLIDMGRLRARHPAAIALRWLERSLYRSADKIVVLMPRAGDYIGRFGVEPSRTAWIPNGVDLDSFPPIAAKQSGGSFTFMYFGAHGNANALDNILRAMSIVQADSAGSGIFVRLIGEGPAKPLLVKMAAELGLKNVRFEDPVAKSSIPAIAAAADAFLICARNLPTLYRFGISMNKIFDYMAAGRPTIIAVDAVNNPITEGGSGIAVAPDDPQAFAAAMLRIASLPKHELSSMGLAGRKHLERNYEMKQLSARLADVLEEVVRVP